MITFSIDGEDNAHNSWKNKINETLCLRHEIRKCKIFSNLLKIF